MGRVSASVLVPGPVTEVEALWYDTDRWPTFIEGFHHVRETRGAWPAEGAKLTWESTPHGRGRVVERVVAHEPLGGQTVIVEEQRLRGTQRVSFMAEEEAVRLTVDFEYRLASRNPLTPVIDLLFVRRAVGDALRRTVLRFGRERVADIELS